MDKEKKKQYNLTYYKKNRDKIISVNGGCHKEYYQKNRDRILAERREYYKNNRDFLVAKQRRYCQKRRDYILKKQKELRSVQILKKFEQEIGLNG